MGIQGLELIFTTAQPTPLQLVTEAKRLGGIDIDMIDPSESELTVAFSGFPQGKVTILTRDQNRLFIMDYSMVAPVLCEILFIAGISLGGHSSATTDRPSLALPLTNDAIRRATRQGHFLAVFVSFLLILIFAAAVVIVGGIVWLLAHYAHQLL